MNSMVVSKIANVDYPDQWPDLLPTILHIIQTGSDLQLHGSLKVLADVVEESLSEDQFFSVARDIVSTVYGVAINEARLGKLRALAVSVFRGTFDIMEMVKDEHGLEVKAFTFNGTEINVYILIVAFLYCTDISSNVRSISYS